MILDRIVMNTTFSERFIGIGFHLGYKGLKLVHLGFLLCLATALKAPRSNSIKHTVTLCHAHIVFCHQPLF